MNKICLLLLVFLMTSCIIRKNEAFYCYEYSRNYKVRLYPNPSWIIHNYLNYTRKEKLALKKDIPLSIRLNINTCTGELGDVSFLKEGMDSNLTEITKTNITKALQKSELTILPIEKDKGIMCDTSFNFNIWVK